METKPLKSTPQFNDTQTQYWLFKSEPNAFSIDALKACENSEDSWDGVRNYQARNFMRDQMKVGDLGLFYHSNCKEIGVVVTITISRAAYPDHFAWDPKDMHYDPKSTPDNPRWWMVNVQFKEHFPNTVSLNTIKEDPYLKDMLVARRGNRLSITPVTHAEFERICELGRR